MELKIEYVDKDRLRPYAKNAKIHTKEQIKQIKKSIKEFGFNDPIAIWRDNQIIEGHGRLLAVMEMDDIIKVPVIRLDGLTDEQRKAYMLIHNKLTMNTDFDIEMLKEELNDIVNYNMNDYGFDDVIEKEIKDLSDVIIDKYEVIIVECKDEMDMQTTYEWLVEEGYTCRLSTL